MGKSPIYLLVHCLELSVVNHTQVQERPGMYSGCVPRNKKKWFDKQVNSQLTWPKTWMGALPKPHVSPEVVPLAACSLFRCSWCRYPPLFKSSSYHTSFLQRTCISAKRNLKRVFMLGKMLKSKNSVQRLFCPKLFQRQCTPQSGQWRYQSPPPGNYTQPLSIRLP